MKNTFLVSELFYPNKTSTAYIMTEIAKAISVNKKVNIVTADTFYDDNIDQSNSLNTENLIIYKPIKISGDKNSIYGRIKNSLGVSLSFTWFLLTKVKKNDTIFAVTNPFLLVLTISILRCFIKFKYVLLVHDVFPENSVPAGLSNEKSLLYKISKFIFDWAYGKAEEKIVLGRDMFKLVSEKSNKGNINIIENWFDEDINFDENIDKNRYLGIKLDDKIVIGFSGNIGRVQNILEFIKIFSKSKNEKLHFVIIGDGAEINNITSYIKDNNIKNVTYHGSKPRDEQSKFLACFDIGLITLSKGMYGLGVPSKTYNLLAMGKPIFYIGDSNSEIDLLVKDNNIGWTNVWNEDQLIKELDSISDIKDEYKINSRNLALNNFSSQIILEKFKNLLND